MFIERTIFFHLVYNIHTITGISQKHINMITICSFCTSNISISIIHGNTPCITMGIYATAFTSPRIFNSNIKSIYLYMAFLIISGLFLGICRISVHFLLLLMEQMSIIYTLRIIKDRFTFHMRRSNKFTVYLLIFRFFATFALRRVALGYSVNGIPSRLKG